MNTKILAFLSLGTAMVLGWIWKFFPTGIGYLWLKDLSGFASGMYLAISLILTGCLVFQLLTDIFQEAIWELEKKIIRRFQIRLHWMIGMVGGIIIIIATNFLVIESMYKTINLGILLSDYGFWMLIGLGFIAAIGNALGWAMFSVHARIANWLNASSPPFLI